MPFLRRETYREMFDAHIEAGAGHTLLAGIDDPIPPYGRLIYQTGKLADIIEESACDEAQKKIPEVNVGVQVLQSPEMWAWLRKIDNDNPKREYYLTSAVRVLARENVSQKVVTLKDPLEMKGVNTMEDLQKAEEIIRKKKISRNDS